MLHFNLILINQDVLQAGETTDGGNSRRLGSGELTVRFTKSSCFKQEICSTQREMPKIQQKFEGLSNLIEFSLIHRSYSLRIEMLLITITDNIRHIQSNFYHTHLWGCFH